MGEMLLAGRESKKTKGKVIRKGWAAAGRPDKKLPRLGNFPKIPLLHWEE
jgi:hypothetical protein